MILRFSLSGSIVFEGKSDVVPPVGSTVTFQMQTYKKGMEAGTFVSAKVTSDIEPNYEFGDGEVVVTLDVDEFVEYGPAT